ncbi:MAG TPA: putative baseplate assembly protein, partial [Gemmatimonadaceae bacterium]|nr:putative baseplate assembly protein [Gemmatimonadaceae bacterium]
AVIAFNNAQFESLQGALSARRASPFVGLPSQLPALYAAFTLPPARKSFPNRPVSVYHGVRLPPYGEPVVPLSPEFSVQAAAAGATVVHRFTLTNSTTDVVDCDFTVMGGAWASSIDASHLQLPPSSAREIQISVNVPRADQLPSPNAADRGFLNVRLSSDSVVHSAAFETRVGDVAAHRRELGLEYWNGNAWARLIATDGTNLLQRPGVIEFLGPVDFAPSTQFGVNAYWMRTLLEPGDAPSVQLRTFLLNTTFATNTVTSRNEVLGSSDASASETFRTTRRPVLAGPQLEVREPGPPSATELADLTASGTSAVTPAAGTTSEVWVRWIQVADFHGSGPRDRHYVLDHISGEVRFGDGVQGRIPPRGIGNIRMARYQTGGGSSGNRAAGTIVQLHDTVPYIDRVTNVEAAEGGVAAESNASLVTRGPRVLRHGGRAVALEDYEDLARSTSPEVARAKTVPVRRLRDDPLGNTAVAGAVSVIIVPQSSDAKPLPSAGLMAQVEDHLRTVATPTASIAVVGPLYVRVDVAVEIALATLEGAREVEDAVRAALRTFLHPLTGGRQAAGWDFGRRPFLSDLYAVVSDVCGVDHVRQLSAAQVEDVPGALNTGRFLVYSGEHRITLTFVGAE